MMNDVTIYDKKFIFFILSTMFGILSLSASISKQGRYFVEKDYVTVYISTINSQNKPLIGAEVYINNLYAGMSDSYGKYRFHSRVALGQDLKIKAFKKSTGHILEVHKTIAIPPKSHAKRQLQLNISAKLKRVQTIAVR